jgi:hypothetical protein
MAAKPRKSWVGPQAIKQSLIVRLKLHTSFETRTNPIWRGCCSFMLCEGSRTHCTHGGGYLKPENTLYKKAWFGGIGRFAFTDMHYSPCKFCSWIVESKSIFYMQAEELYQTWGFWSSPFGAETCLLLYYLRWLKSLDSNLVWLLLLSHPKI